MINPATSTVEGLFCQKECHRWRAIRRNTVRRYGVQLTSAPAERVGVQPRHHADDDKLVEDGDTFDEERVPDHLADFARQFEHSKAVSGRHNRHYESHLDLCCGPKLSKSHAALSADSKRRVLALDILKEKDIDEETDTWPLDFRQRFTYVKFDLRDFTYRWFQNVVRDYLGIKVTSLSTVHVSSPCTTYTKAHHGKNPHRYNWCHFKAKTVSSRVNMIGC